MISDPLCFFLLADDHADTAERLDDARAAAAGAGRETLHHEALADRSFLDDQRVDVEIVVVLGVGDRGCQALADVDSLVVVEASVGKGLSMKRFATRARGRSARIVKPFSRLRVVVREVQDQEA